jgi:hypothetical protein
MSHGIKSVIAATLAAGALAGCATSVDMGGPLLHYRYNYDSRPVVSGSTVPAPATVVTDDDAPVVYRDAVVVQREPRVVWRDRAFTYRDPGEAFDDPAVVYRSPSLSVPYQDHGQ